MAMWLRVCSPGAGLRRPRVCILCTGVQTYRRDMTISPAQGDWVPQSCSLPTVERPIRVAEFDRFFADAVRGVRRPGPQLLELVLTGTPQPCGG